MARGQKNGFLKNSAGELVLWCNGTEVMAFDTDKASFNAAAPTEQISHIADAGATNSGDESEHINAALAALETAGLVATS